MNAPAQPGKPISPLPGTNALIMGPTGTGKTRSLATLVEAGLRVHQFCFESGSETLRGYWTDRGLPVPDNLRITTVKAAAAGWLDMADNVKFVNTLSYEALKKVQDPNRNKYDQFEKFLRTFNDVTDDTGKKWGPVDNWGTDAVVAIDGLTGLGHAAMQACIGGKADRDQKDWGLAQNLLENFLRKMCDNVRCHFVLLGHIERETDVVLGGSKIMISTLGKALPPKIPPMFADVILAERAQGKWTWSTDNPMADLKTRNLEWKTGLPQDFRPIIEKWKSRGGIIEA